MDLLFVVVYLLDSTTEDVTLHVLFVDGADLSSLISSGDICGGGGMKRNLVVIGRDDTL